MALEDLSPQNMNFYAPRFEVEIESVRLAANISKSIIDVSIEEKIDEGNSFTLTLNDEFDMSTQQFKWLDHQLFTVGNKITIKMGYSNNLSEMMRGKITALEPSFFSGESPTLVLRGQDLSYDYMKRRSGEKTFIDQAYSDIARTIASKAGMLSAVDDTGKFEPFLRKDSDKSYYAFLEDLAKKVGYEFSIVGRTIYFIKPGGDKKEILTLRLGKDIISFRPAMNTAGLVSEVEVRGHNPQDPGTPIVGRAAAGSEQAQESGRQTGSQIAEARCGSVKRVVSGMVVNSAGHANAIAAAMLNEASDSLIEGDAECIGLTQIRPGVAIALEGMGKRFSGKYYVKATTHTINSSGYRTRFSVKRNAV